MNLYDQLYPVEKILEQVTEDVSSMSDAILHPIVDNTGA